MKKMLLKAAAVGMMGLALAGCGGNEASTPPAEVPDGWPSSGLAEKIPVPSGEVASVDIDDEALGAEIVCSIDEFNDYIDACKDGGYTIDSDRESSSFEAYSEEGYQISLYYWDSSETMDIDLSAPIELSEITWPTMGAGSLVPAPASNQGQIDSDNESFFYANIGETDPDAFEDYVNACIEAGFTVDYDKGDTWYYADNAQGVDLSLKYVGFNTMAIRVDSSEQITDAQNETANGAADGTADGSGSAGDATLDVSPDFKASMDAYEDFFDEYVEFMNAYTANPTSTDLMAQYADMLSQYAETMNALNSIDTTNLSAADYAYYVEVTARITEKVASVGM